jgi:predicted dehydrogenase
MRGIHVLIEKPVASTLEEAHELIAAAAKSESVVCVGHIERFNPSVLKLEECLWAEQQEGGLIMELHAERVGPWPTRICDTGVALDLMTHDIDLAQFLIGKPVARLHAESVSMSKHECALSGILRFRGGEIATLHASWLVPRKKRELTVTTRAGHYVANLITQELFFHENTAKQSELSAVHGVSEGNVTGYHIARREPLALELQAFVEKIRKPAEPTRLCSLEDARLVLALALELRAQARSAEGL